MALWKLYGRSNESVAITTTIECLTFVAPSWGKFGRVDIKKVRYINHAGKLPNGVYALDDSLFGLKHQAYAFEKEIRIVVTRAVDNSLECQPKAIRIPVNMNDFLRSIVVAPESGDWFFDLVVDLASKYNVIAPIRRSSLTQLIKKANNA